MTANTDTGHETEDSSDFEEGRHEYRPGGYHPISVGDVLKGRYTIRRKLGFGRYSTVWLASDDTSYSLPSASLLIGSADEGYVAIKVVTAHGSQNIERLAEHAILQRITTADPSHPGYKHVLHLLDSFRLQGPNGEHLFLVCEPLGIELGMLSEAFEGGSLPRLMAKRVSLQLLRGLDYLHQCCGVIHTGVTMLKLLMILMAQTSNHRIYW
jgi:serine/threonine-protein kinase SRPK3